MTKYWKRIGASSTWIGHDYHHGVIYPFPDHDTEMNPTHWQPSTKAEYYAQEIMIETQKKLSSSKVDAAIKQAVNGVESGEGIGAAKTNVRTPQAALRDAIDSGAVQAWIDGQDIQLSAFCEDWEALRESMPAFCQPEFEWRIAPKPLQLWAMVAANGRYFRHAVNGEIMAWEGKPEPKSYHGDWKPVLFGQVMEGEDNG